MIEIKNISKEFEKHNKNKKIKFLANNNISFNLNDGEVLGVLGANGAGKTTLLRIISGIMEPSSGEVLYDLKKINTDEINIKRDIAFLSGNTKLYKSLSAYELLLFCSNIYNISKEEFNNRLNVIVDRLKMKDFLYNRIGNLSTGQQQRVNIARCMIHDPKYYIFDEVTSGLDIISSQIILDFIKEEKKRGKSFIYSTHYMEEAENICDRVIMINKGKVIEEGTSVQINKKTNCTNLRDAFFTLVKGDYNE